MEPALLIRALPAIAAALLALASCKANPAYCEGEPGNRCCTENADCAARGSAPVCNVVTGACEPGGAAPGTHTCDSPVCKGGVCDACAATCPDSGVCPAAGGCAAVADVAYVKGGASGDCSKALPCGTLADALATQRPYILVSGEVSGSTQISQRVEIHGARGAALVPTPPQPHVLTFTGSLDTVVGIYDLDIRGVTTSGAPFAAIWLAVNSPKVTLVRVHVHDNSGTAVLLGAQAGILTIDDSCVADNGGPGVEVSSGTLTVKDNTAITGNVGGGIVATGGDTTITRNTIRHNRGMGGLYLADGTFTIVGNYIDNNVTTRRDVGGVYFGEGAAAEFRFNTVVDNRNATTSGAGIQCDELSAATIRYNVLFDMGGTTNLIASSCTYSYTVLPRGSGTGAGNGNKYVDDVKFVDPAHGDYHLTLDSPAMQAADVGAAISDDATRVDYDGDPRRAPADVGADEVP